MRDEYDFSRAERGRCHRPGAAPVPPVHLEPDVLKFLSRRAESKGVALNRLVNNILKKDIESIEAVG